MPLEVSELILKFKNWRSLKKSPKEKIPKILWDEARILQKKFPDLKLYRLLNITSTNWNKVGLKSVNIKSSTELKTDFDSQFIKIPTSNFFNNKNSPEVTEKKESLKINIGKNIQIFIYGDA